MSERYKSYMELIFIDSKDQARKTTLALSLATNAKTWAEFQSYRRLGVDIKQAQFLLDYHNGNSDLSDTIALDADGFREITGQEPLSEAEYVEADSEYWDDVFRAAVAHTLPTA